MNSLREYLQSLNEANQPTLKNLIDNFGKVFPYSEKDLPIINWHIDGKDSLKMTAKGLVKSEEGKFNYQVLVEFNRESEEEPWRLNQVGKVNCTCNAFRYNTAYPDVKYDVLAGIPKSNNRIPNKIRNKHQIPSVCKHLYSFLHFLYLKKIIQ